MLNTPFSPWPSFTSEEADAVHRVVTSNKVNYWTGTETREFEKEFAAWCQTRYAVALSNGTLALDVALKALGIGPGDEVVVTPRTFIASISCVVNAGAVPVFADVEVDSGNISARTIAAVLTPRTRAVICVHLAGWPCDMDPIMALASAHGLKVIEDCAQAHGARYKGRPVGSIGHVGAWSFCQDKIMTTGGEGGMVTTNDESLWRTMWSYKDHGKSYAAVYERQHPPGFRWLHESFGTNWRMLEMQAVIGRIQLGRMAEWTVARTRHAEAIWAVCRKFDALRVPGFGCSGCDGDGSRVKPGMTEGVEHGMTNGGSRVELGMTEGGSRVKPGMTVDLSRCARNVSTTVIARSEATRQSSGCAHAHYKCYVYVKPEQLAEGWSRDRIVEAINAQGVPCYQGSCSEVYLEKAFDGTGWRPEPRLAVAKALGEASLMFLVHPTLTEIEIEKTCHAIEHVMALATSQKST
jgi:dTDP-4-amino-4,6-dideoxygalactose transaminase